jgi:hypothetical protein
LEESRYRGQVRSEEEKLSVDVRYALRRTQAAQEAKIAVTV